MRTVFNFIAVPAVVFLLGISTLSYAQTPPVPSVPDYRGWQKSSTEVDAVLNGRPVRLLVEIYNHIDWANLKKYTLTLVYNEQRNTWFAYFVEETGERRADGGVSTRESHEYLLESNGGQWTLIQDISDSANPDAEARETIRNRYNLEFR